MTLKTSSLISLLEYLRVDRETLAKIENFPCEPYPLRCSFNTSQYARYQIANTIIHQFKGRLYCSSCLTKSLPLTLKDNIESIDVSIPLIITFIESGKKLQKDDFLLKKLQENPLDIFGHNKISLLSNIVSSPNWHIGVYSIEKGEK